MARPAHPPSTPLGHPAGVVLRVRDVGAARAFWVEGLGLPMQAATPERWVLGTDELAIELLLDPAAPLRPYPSVGLYHLAILLPSRAALAGVARRLLLAGAVFEGAADHGVSEALYFRDAERNGLEIAWDRPRERWPRPAPGEVAMTTAPLDLDALLDEARQPAPVPPEARLGHVHLHVADLDAAERWFALLGLRTTQRSYPGARFLAYGDYHHHLGLNVWAGQRRAPPEATGLVAHRWHLAPGTTVALAQRLRAAGVPHRREDGRLALTDPTGARLEIEERACAQ